jgi:hypothetical protein
MPSSYPKHGYAAVRPKSNTVVVVGPDFSTTVSLDDEREFPAENERLDVKVAPGTGDDLAFPLIVARLTQMSQE